MKKWFKNYAIAWAVLFVFFNLLIALLPGEAFGYVKTGGAFWASLIMVDVAFIGQLVCTYSVVKKADTLEKLFLGLPQIKISYGGLLLTIAVGIVCFIIPDLPNWVAGILALVIFAFYAVSIINAKAAAEVVGDVGEKVKLDTNFIKSLTAELQSLAASWKVYPHAPNEQFFKHRQRYPIPPSYVVFNNFRSFRQIRRIAYEGNKLALHKRSMKVKWLEHSQTAGTLCSDSKLPHIKFSRSHCA